LMNEICICHDKASFGSPQRISLWFNKRKILELFWFLRRTARDQFKQWLSNSIGLGP
jgi:hypothetical protein